jgi:hypothetical protein
MQKFVGIDWGNEEHAVCVVDERGDVDAKYRIKHDIAAVESLIEKLGGRGCLGDVVFAIERRDGLLVDALLEQGAAVWHINPAQLDHFRGRFSASGAKSDALDARVLADCARTDLERAFRRVEPRPTEIVELRGVERLHSSLTEQRIRLENQATEALLRYYPAFVALKVDLSCDWVRALFAKASDPAAAKRLRASAVEALLRRHRVRKLSSQELIEKLQRRDFTAASGVVHAERLVASCAMRQLEVVVEQLRTVEKRMDELLELICAAPQDSTLAAWAGSATALRSMPGVGSKIAATILAEAPEALREGAYRELRVKAGTAPVSKSTGKRSKTPQVSMRYACNHHLRNAMHHWGRTSAQADAHWAELRRRCLARGHTQARANRQVADRLLHVLTAMVRHGAVYDSSRWNLAPEGRSPAHNSIVAPT